MTCKNCKEKISEVKPLHFSNQIARQLGYCSFICMLANLGKEKGFQALQLKMGNIAPEEKKGKSTGVIKGQRTSALNELGRANTITLGKGVV